MKRNQYVFEMYVLLNRPLQIIQTYYQGNFNLNHLQSTSLVTSIIDVEYLIKQKIQTCTTSMLQINLEDFATTDFDPAVYLANIQQDQFGALIAELTTLVNQQKKRCNPQASSVFERFCDSQKIINLTNVFTQLLDTQQSEFTETFQKVVKCKTDFAKSDSDYCTELQNQLNNKEAIIFQLELLEKLEQLSFDDIILIQQNPMFQQADAELKNVINRRVSELTVAQFKQLQAKYDPVLASALLSASPESFYQFACQIYAEPVLDRLLPKYGSNLNETEGVGKIVEIFYNGLGVASQDPNKFAHTLRTSGHWENALMVLTQFLLQKLKAHYSAFFAPVCLGNVMFLFQITVKQLTQILSRSLNNEERVALIKLCGLKQGLQAYVQYLSEAAGQALGVSTTTQLTQQLQQLFDLFVQFPIQIRQKVEQKQPVGLFIPALAVDLIGHFQALSHEIIVMIQKAVENQTVQQPAQKGLFKYLATIKQQPVDVKSNLFQLGQYRYTLKELGEFLSKYLAKMKANQPSKVEAEAVEREFREGYDIYQVYKTYWALICESFEKFVVDFTAMTAVYGV